MSKYMQRKKYYVPKKEYKRDYHEYIGHPMAHETIFSWEYKEDADIEVLEWDQRFV